MERKIIQIACAETATDNETGGTLYALADDGSVWFMTNPWGEGKRWRPIPQLPKKPD